MKPTFQSHSLSGASSNYQPINISSDTIGAPTLIHTADTVNVDEIWLDVYGYTTNDCFLNLLLGGSTAPFILTVPVPAKMGAIPLLKGDRFSGGLVIQAYASIPNACSIKGFVNKIVFI